MNVRPFRSRRFARTHHDNVLVLGVFLGLVSLALLQLFGPTQTSAPSVWDRFRGIGDVLLRCSFVFAGALFLLILGSILKQVLHRYRARRTEDKLAYLEPIARDGLTHANTTSLVRVMKLLRDPCDNVRHKALSAAFTVLRAQPELTIDPNSRELFEAGLRGTQGFARTLAEAPPGGDLLARVTLGAKLGAGTSDKRLAPVTSDPAALAYWVESHRREETNPELQVSVGYDTGGLPYFIERSRFLALYVFISTTDLKRFQALLRRPPRDPNAAYGLVIRGDVVEVKYPGQGRGHRLDYVFPLPVRLSEANLAGLFKEIQLLNLGLLVASVHDSCRVLFRNQPPAWLDPMRQAIGRVYASFERKLVVLLREHDRYRDPHQIHRLVPSDHAERVRAWEQFRLEECLYPQYSWVVPLYDPDTRWERLLTALRAVEAMLLHQGIVDDEDVTRGMSFIQKMRRLGYETARTIEQLLAGDLPPSQVPSVPPDPFIDKDKEDATMGYLTQTNRAIDRGQSCMEDVADPFTFRQATVYYDIEGAEATTKSAHDPENLS